MDTTEQLHFHFSLPSIGEGNGTPLQCSCLEDPSDGGAWWAAVYGVAHSWTQLKRLSSSSSSTWTSRKMVAFCLFHQHVQEPFLLHFKLNFNLEKNQGRSCQSFCTSPPGQGPSGGPQDLSRLRDPPEVPVASKPKKQRVLTLWLWLPFGRWGCGPRFIPEPEEGDGVGSCVK